MCYPILIPIAALVIGAAGTAYTVQQQQQQTKYNNQFQADMAKQGSALARTSFLNQANQENYRQSQANDAAAQARQQNEKHAAQAKATAAVSAGEAGVSGVSIDALQSDFNRQEAQYNNSLDVNRSWSIAQSQANMQGLRAGALDRISSLTPNPQQAPSYLGAALRIGGQSMDTYNSYFPYKQA